MKTKLLNDFDFSVEKFFHMKGALELFFEFKRQSG